MDILNEVHFENGEEMDNWQPPEPVTEAEQVATDAIITNKVFLPNWDNKPKELPAILTLADLSILTHQNMTVIIAPPGFGKSSICESIAASILNPDADCLGFKVDESCRGIIYIDFERTNSDVWNSFYRMCRRAGLKEGQKVQGVKVAGMRSIPRLTERLEAIEYLLQNNPCSLLILDGAGDMVTDTNDLPQAIECRIFLRELTVKYDLSILTTLHPNPGTFKPRGHVGSELTREAECALLLKKGENDNRIITSDFEHGKNRNNAPITTGYKWDNESMMFLSVDIEGMAAGAKEFKNEQKKKMMVEIASAVIPALQSISEKDLVKAIMKYKTLSDSQAIRYKRNMIGWDIITKRADGLYQLFIP